MSQILYAKDKGQTFCHIMHEDDGTYSVRWGTSVSDFLSGIEKSTSVTFLHRSKLSVIEAVITKIEETKGALCQFSITGPGLVIEHDGSWDHDYDTGFWVDKDDTITIFGEINLEFIIENGKLIEAKYIVLREDHRYEQSRSE
ncbi:MAG: hypothetical protein UW23_C0003G0012 [Candidatus Collierbacteria bacterium GW2011_GWA1_44_12]|uniref:Uncharacterized protein n=1 Tax=Candidatus Collierbacteria bacterium GW2011_GWA1_44_12 TaxID=1618376 RepID=A0A0G1GMW3_9BACT|nr:MAG: hypothetical protein UW23_C0003G0012 [Candidatus Collierbacteria bacterium GW2011_GWA1_44_12]